MKNQIITLALVIGAIVTNYAQIFPSDSAYWKVEHGSVECVDPYSTSYICWEKQYFLYGDTVIESQQYNKLYSSGRYRNFLSTGWSFFDEGYIGAIRNDEASKKVFFKPASSSEVLLYDFNLNIGDTLPTSYVYNPGLEVITIDQIDTVIINELSIVRYHMDYAGFGEEYILEGIGSTLGLLEEITPFFEHHYALMCYENYETSLTYPVDGDCELITDIAHYRSTEELRISVFPNPITSNATIEIEGINENEYTLQVFNILGGKLGKYTICNKTTTLNFDAYQPGIYFINVLDQGQTITVQKIIKK